MDFSTTAPIWLQMVDEFRRRIVSNEWPPGQRIPSVRELAVEMRVNPNTAQRAMSELDRTGLTITQRNSGRFVTNDAQLIADERADLIGHAADAFVHQALAIGLTLEDVQTLITERWSHDDQ